MSVYTASPQEFVPIATGHNLYTDPVAPADLQHFLAETDDHYIPAFFKDPDPGRIDIRFFPRPEDNTRAGDVVEQLLGMDYILIDSLYAGNREDRRMPEVAQNLALSGTRLFIGASDKARSSHNGFGRVDPELSEPDPILAALADSAHYQNRDIKPVVRIIGFGLRDQLPGEEATLKAKRETIESHIANYSTNVFTEPNSALLDRLKAIIPMMAKERLAVEEQLRADMVNIVANAALRHPDAHKLDFGVILHPRYYGIAGKLVDSTGALPHPVATVENSSIIEEAEQEMVTRRTQTPRAITLKRTLLTDYVQETFEEKLGDAEMALRIARDFETGLTDQEVNDVLRAVNEAKTSRLHPFNLSQRSENARRRSKIIKRIWKHPHVAAFRKENI